MPLTITANFAYSTAEPMDILLQFEAAATAEQRIVSSQTKLADAEHYSRAAAEDGIGERIWLRSDGRFEVSYSAQVEIMRAASDLAALGLMEPHDLPPEAVQYLRDSRYCPAARFQGFAAEEFAGTDGGARVLAIRDWIARHFKYVPGASGPDTTGEDSFIDRRGVCRDYAHVLVMLARASTIPARYVSCYGLDVTPQDFHGVAEVFLADDSGNGAWHLVDATLMATPEDIAIIGVGRDAADVSFLTSFGPSDFISSKVAVSAA